MKKTLSKSLQVKIIIFIVLVIIILISIFLETHVSGHLVINEIAFSKNNKIDWIEIYNPTLNNLSLEGLYLSDNANNFSKFNIKDQIIVPSKGYAIIYGNGYEGELNNSIVANFRISNGETIYLVAKNGSNVIDSLTAISPDNALTEFSIGRFPDGSEEIFIMSNDTPGAANQKDMLNQQILDRDGADKIQPINN